MDDTALSPTSRSRDRFRLGEAIDVTFEVRNTTDAPLQLLVWGTPLEEPFTEDCLIVERDGERIPYDSYFVKRGAPTLDSYVVVRAGQTVRHTVDISHAYAIDRPGNYTVTVAARARDAFAIVGNAKVDPKDRTFEPLRLSGAVSQFRVEAGETPRSTAGEAARAATTQAKATPGAPVAKSAAKTPNLTGGTTAEQDATLVAHHNAQVFAALAARQLVQGPASTNALFGEWFGAFDQARYDKVTKHYDEISDNLLNNTVTYDLTGTGCQAGWYAYTFKGSSTVWLCSVYLSAPDIGTDCKFGTLIHEWSHAVVRTDDHQYGEAACRTLATNDPAQATENADSHEYFAEHLAQSDFGKTLTLVTDRSTFGKDEIDVMLASSPTAVIGKAFYVIADGSWPARLGITAASLGAKPNVKPTLTLSPNVAGMTVTVTELQAEDTTLPAEPQRFTWVCQVAFTNDSGFPTGAGQTSTVTLTATLAGGTASAQIQLIREPNPYELDGPTSWLSTDVRVFQLRAGDTRFGATMGSTPTAASTYIGQVLANLNAGTAGGQTFDSISTDPQTSKLELSEKVNGTKIYNFAVAKVRYRGSIDISNVRVFFRLFPAATTSTDFDPATTYRRTVTGPTTIPLLGLSSAGDILSIPCLAASRVDTATVSLTTQTDPVNVRTIVHDAGGGEVAAYFGCWLDINQPSPAFPNTPNPANGPWSNGRKSVQELVRNAHQCLVAEIAFDPDPVPNGVSPGASDKLAQRNLAIIESPNPGLDASRRILTTFELRPATPVRTEQSSPDELMIEWGDTPPETTATVYIPEVGADQILELADRLYGHHTLSKIDEQTITLSASGISYLPLPRGASFGLTGLLTLELPTTVRKGDLHTVLVRQISDTGVVRPPTGDDVRKTRGVVHVLAPEPTRQLRWRRVVGSYQIAIPVRTKTAILPDERRLLSVLRWILAAVPAADRWHPVFSRYVSLVGERVRALGGDPDTITPSPDGSGVPGEQADDGTGGEPCRPADSHVGKITGLIYDCFGDFDGFILDSCGVERIFSCHEPRLECLADRAWRERIQLLVSTTDREPRHVRSIVFRHYPIPCEARR